jgi:hypothetical protein
MKLYAFCQGHPSGVEGLTISADGDVIAGHFSSNSTWARHDMGADGRSDWKHDIYDKKYGAGNWEIEWVENPDEHPGLMAAIAANHAQPHRLTYVVKDGHLVINYGSDEIKLGEEFLESDLKSNRLIYRLNDIFGGEEWELDPA